RVASGAVLRRCSTLTATSPFSLLSRAASLSHASGADDREDFVGAEAFLENGVHGQPLTLGQGSHAQEAGRPRLDVLSGHSRVGPEDKLQRRDRIGGNAR